ncbi:TetR/AcrR family transcriptional regulator [Ferrovibrio terrae]|uniref:TetR/AcrR family transcriptional regulator n=1 Tax=Ferrovibrio terrae TaxID=2594003 RepID=UPI003137B018
MPAALLSRDDLIARLGDVFREHGFEGASLSAITAATGLGKGSLYNHFPGGKDEMATAVLAHVDAWFEHEVYAPLRDTGRDAEDPRQAIAAMFAAVDTYFRGGGRICLVGAFALDATRDRFAAAVQDYFVRWIAALAACLRRGGVKHARALAETIVAGIQGALVLSRALNDTAAFGRQLRQLQHQAESALA